MNNITPEKSPYTFEELKGLVIDWAKPKDIASEKQEIKIIEEFGELCGAILKLEKEGNKNLIDSIGDVLVTLIIQSHLTNSTPLLFVNKADARIYDINKMLKDFQHNYLRDYYNACGEVIQSIAYSYGYCQIDCLFYAYSIISKRKGKTIDGVFVKENENENEKN